MHSDILIRTESETDRDKWVATLEELQKAAKQSPNKLVMTLSQDGFHPEHPNYMYSTCIPVYCSMATKEKQQSERKLRIKQLNCCMDLGTFHFQSRGFSLTTRCTVNKLLFSYKRLT